MGNGQSNPDAVALRHLVSRFLTSNARLKLPLLAALSRITDKSLPAVLFGGSVRDVMLRGPSTEPRDVDIVVDASLDDLTNLFADILVRKTRFGGLHLNARGWKIDVWPLAQTWAFRELRVGAADFDSLTKTTFLNVEAVAVDISPRPRGRKVRTSGFFEGIKRRTLDINLEENPFPGLAAVRTLITASTLSHGLSGRLARYVSHQLKIIPLEQLVRIQVAHYGWVRCDIDLMHKWAKVIQQQIGTQSVIRLPQPTQLSFWRDFHRGAAARTPKSPDRDGRSD